MVLDNSGSMMGHSWTLVKKGVEKFLVELKNFNDLRTTDKNDQVSII